MIKDISNKISEYSSYFFTVTENKLAVFIQRKTDS